MALPKFFEVKDNEISLARDEIRLHPEFRIIISRDKGSEGDFNGTKKYRGSMELAYDYHSADIRSPYYGYDEEEKLKAIMFEVGLPNDWRPDKVIKEAIKKYEKLFEIASPSFTAYRNIREGLESSKEAAAILNMQLKAIIKKNKKKVETADENVNIIDLIEGNDAMIALTDKLIKLIATVSKASDELDKIETKMKSEIDTTVKIRGGGSRYNREDAPDDKTE